MAGRPLRRMRRNGVEEGLVIACYDYMRAEVMEICSSMIMPHDPHVYGVRLYHVPGPREALAFLELCGGVFQRQMYGWHIPWTKAVTAFRQTGVIFMPRSRDAFTPLPSSEQSWRDVVMGETDGGKMRATMAFNKALKEASEGGPWSLQLRIPVEVM